MSIKLLIVEDSPLDHELMLRELKLMDENFETKLVTSQPEFEKVLADWNPDIIISDFDLKSFSGKDILSYAKKVIPGYRLSFYPEMLPESRK